MSNCKIVCTIEFPDGYDEYVIWEPLFYGEMIKNKVDVSALFYDISKNGFRTPPLNVWVDLYIEPRVEEISQKWGDNEVLRQVLLGKKCFTIAVL
jgi:hypothetical protein